MYISREIGHRSVQVEETSSNVSSPVSLDTLSVQLLSQSQRAIHLFIHSFLCGALIKGLKCHMPSSSCSALLSKGASPKLNERCSQEYLLIDKNSTQCSIAPFDENH